MKARLLKMPTNLSQLKSPILTCGTWGACVVQHKMSNFADNFWFGVKRIPKSWEPLLEVYWVNFHSEQAKPHKQTASNFLYSRDFFCFNFNTKLFKIVYLFLSRVLDRDKARTWTPPGCRSCTRRLEIFCSGTSDLLQKSQRKKMVSNSQNDFHKIT